MTADERFEAFFKALAESHPIWWDGLPLIFPPSTKDYRLAAKKVWLGLHSEGKIKKDMDWKEARGWLQKELTWQEPKSSDGFEKAVPVEIHPKALTGEARAARIKEFLDVLGKVGNPETTKNDAFKYVRQEIKPSGETYKPDRKAVEQGVLMENLKIQYGREHCDLYTGKTLEGHITWDEFIKDKGL